MLQQALNNMKWTKLDSHKILDLYKDREYHNIDHISDMYDYLHNKETDYDTALDYAVLFHDVIYDELPNKELRSIEYFSTLSSNLNLTEIEKYWVRFLIRSTITHELVLDVPSEQAMIQADLCGLLDYETAIINREKIKKESIRLYNISEKEFYITNTKFMLDLGVRLLNNISKSVYDIDKEFYSDVISTIQKLIKN